MLQSTASTDQCDDEYCNRASKAKGSRYLELKSGCIALFECPAGTYLSVAEEAECEVGNGKGLSETWLFRGRKALTRAGGGQETRELIFIIINKLV